MNTAVAIDRWSHLTARLAEAQQEAMGALGGLDLGSMFGGGEPE